MYDCPQIFVSVCKLDRTESSSISLANYTKLIIIKYIANYTQNMKTPFLRKGSACDMRQERYFLTLGIKVLTFLSGIFRHTTKHRIFLLPSQNEYLADEAVKCVSREIARLLGHARLPRRLP